MGATSLTTYFPQAGTLTCLHEHASPASTEAKTATAAAVRRSACRSRSRVRGYPCKKLSVPYRPSGQGPTRITSAYLPVLRSGFTFGGMQRGAGVVYDAFVSFTRKGHPGLAHRICRAFEQAGMRVFADAGISEGDSISGEIIAALARSMTLIVVYSRQYLGRNACQEELRRVFVAAEAEGDPSRRIIVVNPEDGNDHIAPAELRDARYVVARGADADLSGLIRAVRDRSAGLAGPLSAIKRASPPRWLPPRIPGTSGFVGRHGDMWRLHTAPQLVDRR
jgi:hypothetical protein